MFTFFRNLQLQTKIISLICGVLMVPLIAANIHITRTIDESVHQEAAKRADDTASIVASSSIVIEGMEHLTPEHQIAIQNYTDMLSKIAQVQFIVIIDMNGVRVSHPDKNKVGQHMIGSDEQRVLNGDSYISLAKGSLGISQRAFRPIYSAEEQQIGAVVVGILSDNINQTIANTNKPIFSALTLALLIGILAAILLSHNIKNILLGLEPVEIARLLEERNAILQSVREGIIAIDNNYRLTVINDEAKRILNKAGIKGDLIGQKVDDCIPHTRLCDVLKSGEAEYDREQKLNGSIIILTNRASLRVNNEIVGAIATFRDMTEISRLAEELTGVNRYAEALRSQAHEFLNKIHVIYGLVASNNKKELEHYLTKMLGDNQAENEFIHHAIKEPLLAGFLASKFSRARELGVKLQFDIKGVLPEISNVKIVHGLITILGNLIDNGLDAVQQANEKRLNIRFDIQPEQWVIEVKDSGPGIEPEKISSIFTRGYSTKGDYRGIGLYLVAATLAELNGKIEVATQPGNGMSFLIYLPISTLAEQTTEE